jgi:hypothetical protein
VYNVCFQKKNLTCCGGLQECFHFVGDGNGKRVDKVKTEKEDDGREIK